MADNEQYRTPVSDEARQVETWRYERMISLGYTTGDALDLVEAGVDWHTLQHLISDLHCPPPLAKAICS